MKCRQSNITLIHASLVELIYHILYDTTSVDRDEFCDILVSRQKLVRCNDRSTGLHGLFDAQKRTWFVINEEKLFV